MIEADLNFQSPHNGESSRDCSVQPSKSGTSPNIDDDAFLDELASSFNTVFQEEEHRHKSTTHGQRSLAGTGNEGSRMARRISNCSSLGQSCVANSYPQSSHHKGNPTIRTFDPDRYDGEMLQRPKSRDHNFQREDYLHRHLKANYQKLEELQKESFIAIQSAVARLLNDSDEDPPLIYQSLLESRPMCGLCQITYVVHDRMQVLKKVDEQPKLSKARFMQALLGAAVHYWIFEEHHQRCGFTRELREKPEISTMFEDAIRNGE